MSQEYYIKYVWGLSVTNLLLAERYKMTISWEIDLWNFIDEFTVLSTHRDTSVEKNIHHPCLVGWVEPVDKCLP